jgi:hybrid cluster-associated redox disulfide protein
MRVYEIIAMCPEAPEIMAAYGLHCFSCSIGGVESLEDGCSLHGFTDETVEALIDDLNDAICNSPSRPEHVTLTPLAARAIRQIASQEGLKTHGLTIVPDNQGGFCMEFRSAPEPDDLVFPCAEEKDVSVFVSPAMLWRVGGAVIDFREGRFKLDLVDEQATCDCNGKSCGCADSSAAVH